MLLGLSSLMDILPDAIDGFAFYPLEPDSTLPALTNNKTEDGFPGSAMLAFKYVLVKTKATEVPSRQHPLPPNPLSTGTMMKRSTGHQLHSGECFGSLAMEMSRRPVRP